MKKLLFCAILASFSFISNGQDFKFGIKAGANASTISGLNGSRLGLHAGLFAELPLSEKFSIQPELLYSAQGTHTNEWDVESYDNLEYVEYETKAKVDYLTLPVLAKYYVFNDFSIEAGPQIGYLLNAKFETEKRGDISGTTTETYDVKDGSEDIDISAAIGVSYNLPLNFTASLRYTYGLTEIAKGSNKSNNVFQISFGYHFL